MKRNRIYLWGILALFIFVLFAYNQYATQPVSSGRESLDLQKLYQPIQVDLKNEPPINLEVKGLEFKVYPQAEYTVYAMLVSKKNYSFGNAAKVSPVDLALAWGGMMDEEANKYVSYRQNNRWYYYTYKAEFPYDKMYISSQTSNNHIIPDNDNILKAIKKLKKGDKFILQGYLVNAVYENDEGREYYWNTSTTRTDTGAGACEVIYVDIVNIDGKVYK